MAKESVKGSKGSKGSKGAKGAVSAKGPKRFVYSFGNGKADGNRTMKDTLGGKGAGLAEMTNAGLPVPPGFTISTDACRAYMHGGWPKELDAEVAAQVGALEKKMRRKLGDPADVVLRRARFHLVDEREGPRHHRTRACTDEVGGARHLVDHGLDGRALGEIAPRLLQLLHRHLPHRRMYF